MIEFDMILNDLVFCVFLKKSNYCFIKERIKQIITDYLNRTDVE